MAEIILDPLNGGLINGRGPYKGKVVMYPIGEDGAVNIKLVGEGVIYANKHFSVFESATGQTWDDVDTLMADFGGFFGDASADDILAEANQYSDTVAAAAVVSANTYTNTTINNRFPKLTQAEYDALPVKDDEVYYFIKPPTP